MLVDHIILIHAHILKSIRVLDIFTASIKFHVEAIILAGKRERIIFCLALPYFMQSCMRRELLPAMAKIYQNYEEE